MAGLGPRVLWVVVAAGVAATIQQVVVVLASRRVMPELRFRRAAVRLRGAREIVTFGGWSYAANLANKFGAALPPLLLGHFAHAVQVSTFHLGTQAPRQIQGLLRAVRAPLLPVVTGLIARGEQEAAGNLHLRVGRYMLWLMALPAVPLIVFRHEVIQLYVGERYAFAAGVMACLLAHGLVAAGNALFPQLALATGRVRSWALCAWFAELLHAGFSYVLVREYRLGARGAALGYLLAGVFAQATFAIPLGLRHARVPLRVWLREAVLRGSLPGLLTAGALAALRAGWTPSGWFALGTACAAGGLLHVGLVALCARAEDYRDLRELRARAWRKLCAAAGAAAPRRAR